MLDTRMITLYKQHYLDNYPTAMECQYSCLGYYDGLDIGNVEECNKVMIDGQKTPFFDMWFATIDKGNRLKGRFSSQNIEIFKYYENDCIENVKKFWKEQKRMPFFGVCFVQLDDIIKYKSVDEKVEVLHYKASNDSYEYGVISYNTYDNADMVILVHANSIHKLEELIHNLEVEQEVVYLHSVWGISEDFLKFYKDSQKDIWRGTVCQLGEKIHKVVFKVVTSLNTGIIEQLLEMLNGKVDYSFVTGHENTIINLYDVMVSDLLMLFVSGGFSTHQNVYYGKNGVYNIETSLVLESGNKSCGKNKGNITQSNKMIVEPPENRDSWCEQKIMKLQEIQQGCLSMGDEGMFACFHSLIQTLNMLAQYEKYSISKNVFMLLYPSLNMFFEQMYSALESEQNKQKVKSAICKYLGAVNSMIYHTIHTDQVFLMIPGYSGSMFVVPIKICMLYMWYIEKVIYVLNDSLNGHEYNCLLTPVLETKPNTCIFDMGLPPEGRLICIELSQRSLYTPDYLMLILTHEIAHYVGDGIRQREERLNCLVKNIVAILTEGIVPVNNRVTPGCNKYIKEHYEYMRQNAFNLIFDELSRKVTTECVSGFYHVTEVLPIIQAGCRQVLVNEKSGVRRKIYAINREIYGKIVKDTKYEEIMYEIYHDQEECDLNRKRIIASGEFGIIISELFTAYREVFSDMAAYAILGFTYDKFTDAFKISEGVDILRKQKQPQQWMREKLIKNKIFQTKQNSNEEVLKEEIENDMIQMSGHGGECRKLYDELFLYDITQEMLSDYSNKCYTEIIKRFEQADLKKSVNELRDLFGVFCSDMKEEKRVYDIVLEKNWGLRKLCGKKDGIRITAYKKASV